MWWPADDRRRGQRIDDNDMQSAARRSASAEGALAHALRLGLIGLALVGAGAAMSDRAHAQSVQQSAAGAQSDQSKEARLRELKALYDKGLLSRAVFLDEQRRILRAEPTVQQPAAAASLTGPPGAGGLRAGNRWEYAVVNLRRPLPFKRLFEISDARDHAIVERVVTEDGRIVTAEHQKGAYVDMSVGMQFAPYYFAFKRVPDLGPISDVKIKNGDPCAYGGRNPYNMYECEVVVKFVGAETVSVPAGTFEAQVVRVEITQNTKGFTTGWRSRSIAIARYWFVPKTGRFVRAVIRSGDGSRGETMELISTNVALAQ
jgi:hypothetical protein